MTENADTAAERATEHGVLLTLLLTAWRWFGAYRRTRPFWGSVWLTAGGGVVIWVNSYPITLALSGGWNAQSGYLIGGGMILFGLTGLVAPFYAKAVGLFGVLMALAAFLAANLGGFVIGSVLGVLGGSMLWGWGEKGPRTTEGDATLPTPRKEAEE